MLNFNNSTMKQSNKVIFSIIIVSYNTKELLKQCIESITKNSKTSNISYEIIVVDNNSKDDSVKFVNSLIRNKLAIKLIENKNNVGFAKANNQGIKIAQGKYIMLLNSDTIILNNALEKMVDYLEKNRDVAVLGPKLLNADRTPQPSVGNFPSLPVAVNMLFFEHFVPNRFVRWSPKTTRTVDWVMGAALMSRREIFNKIGGLDENIFMYMEELEWCYRVKKNGYKIYFYPQAKIVHLGQGSSKTGRKDPIINIYKGLIYFYRKHYPSWQTALLKVALKIKAGLSYLLGTLINNSYLKETYGEAFKI